MLAWLSTNLLWTQANSIAFVLIVLICSAILFFRRLLYVILPFALFTLYFFRNPERICYRALRDSSILVSPADGRVVDVQYDEKNGFEGYAWKIAIFLSPFDVHVNWVPTPGIINRIAYRPGTFTPAFVPKSSELNERADIHIQSFNGRTLIVRQIAGAVARRIVCWVNEGDHMKFGDTLGMIRFGSRVEILLPSTIHIDIGVGERVYGGETVLGRWL